MALKAQLETIFCSGTTPIKGRSSKVIIRRGRKFAKEWQKSSSGLKGKRRPYVKVTASKGERQRSRKVFLDRFEEHLHSKNIGDVTRRMRLLPCVRDLLENSGVVANMEGDICQFSGRTPRGQIFEVVLKEENGELFLLTFYPSRPERKSPHH